MFKHRKRGITILEVTVGAAMAAALLALLATTFLAVERNARGLDERAYAMRTLENLLEQATAGDWASIDDARVESLELPEELLERWPDATLAGRVVESDDPAPAKQVMLTLTRSERPHERALTITTWIYRLPEN